MYLIIYRLRGERGWCCSPRLFKTRELAQKFIDARLLPVHDVHHITYTHLPDEAL